jgi:small GTP-binding protein
VLQPARLVLCGAQNAGKSTLMNRLLFQARVLTGDLPGLTRDPVSEIVDLDGYSFELVDTAGEGPAGSAADRAALLRARQVRASALRLLVIDGSRPPAAIDRRMRTGQTLVVRSKADLPPAEWPAGFGWDLATSCLDPASAPAVRAALGHALRRLRDLPPAGPVGGVAALDDDGVARLRTALVGVLGAPPGGPADRGSPG